MIAKIIAFCGSGGTGKSSVLELVSNKLNDSGIKNKIHPSVVREFYGIKGISSEKELINQTEADKVKFQWELANYFINRLNNEINNYDGYLLCDRSLYDHLAYWIYSGANTIKLEDYRKYIDLIREYDKNLIALVYFSYPVSFSKDVDPDSFRYAPPAKNLIIASLSRLFVGLVRISYQQLHCLN